MSQPANLFDFSSLPTIPTNTRALKDAQRLWDQVSPGLLTPQEQIDQAWTKREQALRGDMLDLEASVLADLSAAWDFLSDD